ncbi:MAG: hypothetical protein GY862_22060 [Gammaproteobacteria bacterium]|nr:hypothetical protein [Gammaproteobacteria bacterium]
MKQHWTLHVTEFGKLKQADIEIAPMMLFVGENNTGKSLSGFLVCHHPEKQRLLEKFGCLEEEMISPDNIKAYQFNAEREGTAAQALPQSETGFAVPAFNHTIFDLSEETLALQEGIDTWWKKPLRIV